MIIKDPSVAKLFADETRRQILHSLRYHEYSTTDLAKALDKNHSSIMHHLKLLKDAGLVEETRVDRKRNLMQPYYLSTAKRFIVSYSLSESMGSREVRAWQKEMLHKLMEELSTFEINLRDADRDRVERLVEACYLKEQKAFEEAVERQVKPITVEKPVYMALVRLLTNIRLAQDEEHIAMIHELGELLSASVKTNAGN